MIIGDAWRLAPRIATRLCFYLRSQAWDVARLERYRDEMLRRLVRHAGRHVPYYRALFARIGLDPAAFRGWCDLERIPLLDKETLRTKAEAFVADNAEVFRPKRMKTSGSTGTPLRFMLSAATRANDAAATLRSYAWAGFLPGMKVCSIKGYLSDWETRTGMCGRSLDFDTVQLTRESGLRLWDKINRLKPRFFHGYPLAMLQLARIAREAGIEHHCPGTIVSVSESLPDTIRMQLSAAYGGARIFDLYSMTEKCTLISECGHGTRHVLDDFACHEFVDEEGQRVASGRGEIVGTGYYNYAMPMIRYRTRDYARLAPDDGPCPCGRPFRAVAFIEGRKEDYIYTPDGRMVNLVEGAIGASKGIALSQYVQDAPDHLVVNIIPGPDYDPACLAAVEGELHRRVGPAMRIAFKVVDELERRPGDSGKTPFILSKVGGATYQAGSFDA